jgi:hypothetical protein
MVTNTPQIGDTSKQAVARIENTLALPTRFVIRDAVHSLWHPFLGVRRVGYVNVERVYEDMLIGVP